MAIFQSQQPFTFDQAKWEQHQTAPVDKTFLSEDDETDGKPTFSTFGTTAQSADDMNQFIILQLHSDPAKPLLSTTEVVPTLKGDDPNPDINLWVDFDSFKVSNQEQIDPDSKATLQLTIGQEVKLNSFDKLFYCINGGLQLYNQAKGKKADPKDFKKTTDTALGNKPISLPKGCGQITLKVVKHVEPAWWKQIFSFAQSSQGQELLSLVGFGGITEAAVNCVSGMLDMLFDEEPEILFQSLPVKLAFSQMGKEELNGGLTTNYVSSLNPGYWVMAKKADYKKILDLKPVYYSGYGMLAPQGMKEIDSLSEKDNPFSKITYAVIRARMKEVDLKQNIL